MPAYRMRALVLRKTKLGETDLILTLLAQDGRQVRAVAKGARKPGSRFGSRLEPFSIADVLLHSGRNLEVVSEAESVTRHPGLLTDYDRLTAASVLSDVLDKLSLEEQPEERLYALAAVTLHEMERADPAALTALVPAFLVKALAMAGYRPVLGTCAVCAEAEPASAFSLDAGGAVCEACAETRTTVVGLSDEARTALSVLLAATMADVSELRLREESLHEITALLRSFLAYHTGARLRSLDVFSRRA